MDAFAGISHNLLSNTHTRMNPCDSVHLASPKHSHWPHLAKRSCNLGLGIPAMALSESPWIRQQPCGLICALTRKINLAIEVFVNGRKSLILTSDCNPLLALGCCNSGQSSTMKLMSTACASMLSMLYQPLGWSCRHWLDGDRVSSFETRVR